MNLQDKYSVSIVMPTYNRKEVVSKNIRKLLYEQDYDKGKYEVIVVDDGSPDKTSDYLKQIYHEEIKQGRLKVLNQTNQGVAASRNAGIAVASGKYICRMDDDDPPLPNRLKDSIDYFKRNPNKRLMHAKSYWIDESGKMWDNGKTFSKGLNRNRENLAKHGDLENKSEDLLVKENEGKYNYNRNIIHGGTTLAHRSLYEDIKEEYGYVYDPQTTISEDRDLWARIAKFSKERGMPEIGFLDKIIANYTFTKRTIRDEAIRSGTKDLTSYLDNKLNNPTQHTKFVFGDISHLKKDHLRKYLHKLARRSYREGYAVKFVFQDSDKSSYFVRSLDTHSVVNKYGTFFDKRLVEYSSLEKLLEEHDFSKAHEVEYVNETTFLDGHAKLFGENIPYTFTITEDLGLKDFDKNSKKEEVKKRRDLISSASSVTLHSQDNKRLEDVIRKNFSDKKITHWVPEIP